ncbi:type III-B CRISPR-associated protein Cas10/Cmr2 [Oceanithermus sp.]
MRKYLLLLHLGPVQGFIATARRTRDLYAGSRLLSEAAGEVAEFLLSRGAELIFPSTRQKSLDDLRESGVPNVIMGVVNAQNPSEVSELAESARQALNNFFEEKIKQVLNQGRSGEVLTNQEAARRQILDQTEFYWAFVPLNGDYPAARERVQRLIAARKNTRNFEPVTWGAPVPKSSLSGSLESVTHGASERAKFQAGLREGEELSGVDLLKRRYLVTTKEGPEGHKRKQLTFASTTHMALLPFLKGLKKEDLEKVEALARTLQSKLNARYDGWPPDNLVREFPFLKKTDPRVFFPSRHRELAQEGNAEEKAIWEETQSELAVLYRELKREPYPYYALLLADGDRMGKAIDRQNTVGGHRQISDSLAEFSTGVKKVVERHLGSLVYSGGDDVLALLPLHTALDCAAELSDRFRDVLKDFSDADGQAPTLSVGLAVVHHLFDLGEALNLARKAEKEAKKTRNALAVIFSPRSGAETVASGQWCASPPLNKRLETFARWLNQEQIPSGFAYELREAASVLLYAGNDQGKAVLAEEAERILKRKTIPQKAVVAEIQKLIQKIGPDRLANELIVARPFAKAMSLAGKENL